MRLLSSALVCPIAGCGDQGCSQSASSHLVLELVPVTVPVSILSNKPFLEMMPSGGAWE